MKSIAEASDPVAARKTSSLRAGSRTAALRETSEVGRARMPPGTFITKSNVHVGRRRADRAGRKSNRCSDASWTRSKYLDSGTMPDPGYGCRSTMNCQVHEYAVSRSWTSHGAGGHVRVGIEDGEPGHPSGSVTHQPKTTARSRSDSARSACRSP